MTLRLDLLTQGIPIVDVNGNPSPQFQVFWQRFATSIENAVNGVQDALDAAALADSAASAANAAAATAQTAADTTTAATNLANSFVTGLTLTATDAGASATLTISAHTRVYGDGTSVAVSGGTVTGLAYSTLFYVYYDDPSRAGGAVSYFATTDSTVAAQAGDRHVVGKVTTPAALGSPSPGRGVYPPGSGLIP